MSMDMYKEIGSGMPGAVVSLTGTCINRKGMLNNSEYNSDFYISNFSFPNAQSQQIEADLSPVSSSSFRYAENQMHQYYIFFLFFLCQQMFFQHC